MKKITILEKADILLPKGYGDIYLRSHVNAETKGAFKKEFGDEGFDRDTNNLFLLWSLSSGGSTTTRSMGLLFHEFSDGCALAVREMDIFFVNKDATEEKITHFIHKNGERYYAYNHETVEIGRPENIGMKLRSSVNEDVTKALVFLVNSDVYMDENKVFVEDSEDGRRLLILLSMLNPINIAGRLVSSVIYRDADIVSIKEYKPMLKKAILSYGVNAKASISIQELDIGWRINHKTGTSTKKKPSKLSFYTI